MTDELSGSLPDVPQEPLTEPAAGSGSGPGAGAAEPAGPAPLGLVRTPTGHPGVDAHLERLADADHLAADGHVEVYEDVHRGLREALAALDAQPVPGPYENRS
ncbi:hypothetical protein BX286_1880 [Streptomyces sp. 3211.6]|uniref:hypothetical protein n=1 Tax=Streptomyces TaxID=1883 RepID=UPI0009A4D984|nr:MULTISPECIES: hypothetical protein [Streptomyces]RKT03940.1 hypothetical protein BX286_1880 [Streptomyces sp. 3211.6]RPF39816.1 hypothetical protein EDD96_3563 [Streptomyces sp. Ag109_G2-6]